MWGPHFSIRATLLTIIGVLNFFIAFMTISNLYDSWKRHIQISIVRQNATISNILYEAEKNFSFERGVALSVLYTSPEVESNLIQELEKYRQAADRSLEQAIDRLEKEIDYDIPASITQVRENHAELSVLRDELDDAMLKHAQAPDPQLLNRYFWAVNSLTMTISEVIENYSLIAAEIDARSVQQVRLKHLIWRITEYAGREYALIGTSIATGKHPSPEVRIQLYQWQGYVENSWRSAYIVARGSGLEDKIRPYIEEAETHYFVTFDQIKDFFYDPDIQALDIPYPVGIELWLELATQAIESFRSLEQAVMEENLIYVRKLEQKDRREILAGIVLLVSAIGLSLYSAFVVIYRVVGPVNTMISALYSAIQGKSYQPPCGSFYSDEIGKLGTVLEAFREQATELEERRSYLNTVLSTIFDAIIAIDSRSVIQMANPAAERMFGYDEEELVGQKISMLMPDNYVDAHFKGMARYLETGEGRMIGTTVELEGKRKNGDIFPIELAITEMKRGSNRLFVGTLRDITQRKAAEESIRQYMEDLERSNRELDDFAYIASHDLKEPLRGLHNFSGFLLEDYQEKLDNEGKEMLQTISLLTQQMESLINALLHYSRLGRTELSIQKADLNELVQSILSMFSILLGEKNAEVIVHDLPSIVCDYVRIKEVYQNLIGNALKYTDKEKPVIEIGLTLEHPKNPGGRVFYVRDNGIGIQSKDMDSIFKIFRRLHPRHAYGGGTGSGLTIAKKIINQHGGDIWAESEGLGKGTTFYFTIPAPRQKAIYKAEIKRSRKED